VIAANPKQEKRGGRPWRHFCGERMRLSKAGESGAVNELVSKLDHFRIRTLDFDGFR
jgi:hypothetical protein